MAKYGAAFRTPFSTERLKDWRKKNSYELPPITAMMGIRQINGNLRVTTLLEAAPGIPPACAYNINRTQFIRILRNIHKRGIDGKDKIAVNVITQKAVSTTALGIGSAISALRPAQAGEPVSVLGREVKWPNSPRRNIFSDDFIPDGRAFWFKNHAVMLTGFDAWMDSFGGVMDATEYDNMTV
jgi:hypothetical protein